MSCLCRPTREGRRFPPLGPSWEARASPVEMHSNVAAARAPGEKKKTPPAREHATFPLCWNTLRPLLSVALNQTSLP